MEADLKAKMDADLKQRIDGLYSIKMQPSLQISSRLDFIISSIDFDAERIMFDLGEDSKKAPKAVNEARCEFVRIVKAVEQKLLSRIQANEPKKADKAFEALESRVNEFSSTTLDQGNTFTSFNNLISGFSFSINVYFCSDKLCGIITLRV